jgi:hypothetical protein
MTSPADAQARAEELLGPYEEHPERYVGAAFVGGFLLAILLRRLGR